ncbi:uncharacterized protein [Centruroides vittatus]|uniref:uncharacterized protein n=1 Tax=Centruroides vittatus TaxID=120091 RepID=UPI0035105D40
MENGETLESLSAVSQQDAIFRGSQNLAICSVLSLPSTLAESLEELEKPDELKIGELVNAEDQEDVEESEEYEELCTPVIVESAIKSLSYLAKEVIIADFIRIVRIKSLFDSLKVADREMILSNIEELPLKLTLQLISDDIYWKRCCLNNYAVDDRFQYKSSWKNIYVEHYIKEKIQNFDPSKDSYDELSDYLKLCSDFMKRLKISQLKSIEKDLTIKNIENFDDDIIAERLNWSILAPYMSNLQELEISYDMKSSSSKYDMDILKTVSSDCMCLGQCLKTLTSLKILCLKDCNLDDDNVLYLVSQLINHKCLQSLDLRHNYVNNESCQALARLLLSDCPINKLILANNRIGSEGAKYLSTGLRCNNKLQHLNLTLNKIEDDGGVSLCKALVNNSTLKRLSVAGNRLNQRAGEAFAYIVKTTSSLTHLDLSANDLGIKVGFRMEKAIKLNKNLRVLDVRLCGFDMKTENIIKDIILERMEDCDGFVIL